MKSENKQKGNGDKYNGETSINDCQGSLIEIGEKWRHFSLSCVLDASI